MSFTKWTIRGNLYIARSLTIRNWSCHAVEFELEVGHLLYGEENLVNVRRSGDSKIWRKIFKKWRKQWQSLLAGLSIIYKKPAYFFTLYLMAKMRQLLLHVNFIEIRNCEIGKANGCVLTSSIHQSDWTVGFTWKVKHISPTKFLENQTTSWECENRAHKEAGYRKIDNSKSFWLGSPLYEYFYNTATCQSLWVKT